MPCQNLSPSLYADQIRAANNCQLYIKAEPFISRKRRHNEWSADSSGDMARGTDSRGQGLLLQHSHKGDTMDEADGTHDPRRGNFGGQQCQILADNCSVPCRSSPGKSIPRQKGGSIGQTQRPRPAVGRCQRITKTRLIRHRRRDQHHSESEMLNRRPRSLTGPGRPHLSRADPPPCLLSLHLVTETNTAPQTVGNPRGEATMLVSMVSPS